MARRINPKSLRQLAIKNGISPSTVEYRLKNGIDKINRMFIHILVGFKKSDNLKVIDYTKILGFDKKGLNYLNNSYKPPVDNITSFKEKIK